MIRELFDCCIDFFRPINGYKINIEVVFYKGLVEILIW